MSWICPKCETENHAYCEVCNEPIYSTKKGNNSGQTFEDIQSHLPHKYRTKLVKYLNRVLGERIHAETIRVLSEADLLIYKDLLQEEGVHISYQFAVSVIPGYQDKIDEMIDEFCDNYSESVDRKETENNREIDGSDVSQFCDQLLDKGREIGRIKKLIEIYEQDLRSMILSKVEVAERESRVISLKNELLGLEKERKHLIDKINRFENSNRIMK